MASITKQLAIAMRGAVGVQRAVETGTYLGDGARHLAGVFPEVVTIELSESLHQEAEQRLADLSNVTALLGSSQEWLPKLADEQVTTLWFLDGHYSGGDTAGTTYECPVLAEIEALSKGSIDDVVIIDDARLFLVAPGPPHKPEAWPTLADVIAALAAAKPSHHITLVDDQLIALPRRVRSVVDQYARTPVATVIPLPDAVREVGRAIKHRSFRRRGRM